MSDEPQKPSVKRMLWFVGALTVALLASFVASSALLFFFEIPPGNRETLVYMLGQLSGFTSACILFWVGTTHQGGLKTELLSKAGPVKE
ncbi:MAG: hypothetical protein OEY86_00865 [Nitrospira sp.]|nr:hypothetical protein [Nitrospira sp.]